MARQTETDPARETSNATLRELAVLNCPYCGEPVRRDDSAALVGDEDCALLKCDCATFPLISGIPILQQAEGIDRLVQLIREDNHRRALFEALNLFRVKWARRSRLHQISYRTNARRLLRERRVTFERAVRLVRQPRVFGDYLLHRYGNPSFLVDVALMPVLAAFLAQKASVWASGPQILDVGCGAGHSTFLMSCLFPQARITAVDQDFVSLYLAKRFLAPHARFVCADAEVPSPFPDSSFDVVHCLDAFHYMRSKQGIVKELRRVVRQDSLWLFPHLHNALQHNITAGLPLTPEAYARRFGLCDLILLDEADVLRNRLRLGEARRFGINQALELESAQSVAIIGGGTGVMGMLPNLSSLIGRVPSRLQVNPLYRGAWRGDALQLSLRWPNRYLREECAAVERILPPQPRLTVTDLAMLDGRTDDESPRLRELIEHFVFVPLPDEYLQRPVTTGGPGMAAAR